ncbi:hypothetical protein Dimus_021685 [Dionaea muscipula]
MANPQHHIPPPQSASTLFLIIFIIISPVALSSAVPNPNPNPAAGKPSAYEVLQSYSFPVGLLPKGIVGYDLDESTGKFAAYMNETCKFSLEGSYQLEYRSTIRGYISNGKLSNLEGVKVKILFLWVAIVEVRRSPDGLEFSVGIASAEFPIDNFYESPQCGCGLDCNERVGNLGIWRGTNPNSESLVESY